MNVKMSLKSMILLAVFALLTAVIIPVGSSNAANNSGNNVTNTGFKNAPGHTTAELIAKATKDSKAVFLIITDSAKTNYDKAQTIATAANESVKKSVVITMNRNDTSNAAVVAMYNISAGPLPILLVISPKGVLSGGYFLVDATADLLINALPSPKQDEVLAAISNNKSVFVVAAKSLFADKAKAVAVCDSAVALNGNRSVLVEINLTDAKEAAFLGLMKVNTATTTSAIVVVNTKGQVTGTFYEATKASTLVALANKVASSCCSGGSKSCGKK